jgi:hypothetical protein
MELDPILNILAEGSICSSGIRLIDLLLVWLEPKYGVLRVLEKSGKLTDSFLKLFTIKT